MFEVVKDNPGLIRDSNSQAILNADVAAYKRFMQQRQKEVEQIELKEKVNNLETDIAEIKSMLAALIKINT
jgi:uncharacterized protein YceH (UPF0502 family)